MRKFYLINELNIRYDLQNADTEGFLANPGGLGYDTTFTYVDIGNYYLESTRTPIQNVVTGNVYFKGYAEYHDFISFVEMSKSLRLIYKPLDTEYFREIDFAGIVKTEIDKDTGFLICPVKMNCKGLYYTEDNNRFIVQNIEGESRYSLRFPFKFNDYSIVGVNYTNYGHDDGNVLVEIYGYVENPILELYIQGILVHRVTFNIVVKEDERLLYSAKDGNNYVILEDSDGVQRSIIKCLSLENDNFFKVPKGTSLIKVTSDKGSILGKVLFTIMTPYKGA